MHGWIPTAVQVIAALALIAAIGWRTRRWRFVWLPWAVLVGVALAVTAYWYVASEGLAGDNPAPHSLWIWIALSGVAAGVLLAGWRGAHWWRRGMSAVALPLCLLCAALALNLWVGYFPTVQTAWNQLTSGPLPDQTDPVTVTAMQKQHAVPPKGTVVPVDIPDAASGFKHRGELVYLPPAWYATDPPPALPTVMMIGGEFNTPADWLRAGNAVKTVDDFAASHDGNAPVLVFVDSGGAFNNDTECVNGSRGNAADHLTKDVVPFMVSNYGVSANRSNWGVVGWSMGGACALDLTVMHPDMFSVFEDIAGDLGPNSGNKAQTIDRLFRGNAAAYASFDPSTVITRHGRYAGITGWFDVNGTAPRNDQTAAANSLCALGSANGITCAVVTQPGKHDWPSAAHAFAAALPWMASQLGTPGDPAGFAARTATVRAIRAGGREVAARRYGEPMPDEPPPEPEPAVEGEAVDDIALQPDTPPSATPASPAAPAQPADTGYTPSGVPTFDSVREKIETRYGTAIGASELAAETPEGRTVDEQYDARQRAAAERLAQIRESMNKEQDDSQ